MPEFPFHLIDVGVMPYTEALALQRQHLDEVLASREAGRPEVGRLLLVEHPAVITVSNRPTAAGNLIATPELLASHGVTVQPTDRGGDITYHGPGQLVAYPIFDLGLLELRIHEYMRMLEAAVIRTCAAFGIEAFRDTTATGVWTRISRDPDAPTAKVCALGVRVRRWIAMHGLAINVTTNLAHFDLIVPCGLVGRPVTSFQKLLGTECPPVASVKSVLAAELAAEVTGRLKQTTRRESATG